MTVITPKTTQTYTKDDCRHAIVRHRGKEYALCYRDDPHSLCKRSVPCLTITSRNGKARTTLYYQLALDRWCELAEQPKISQRTKDFIWEHYHAASNGERRCKKKWEK